jgi:hypothetical protein
VWAFGCGEKGIFEVHNIFSTEEFLSHLTGCPLSLSFGEGKMVRNKEVSIRV